MNELQGPPDDTRRGPPPEPIRLIERSGDVSLRIAAIGDVGVVGEARRRARRDGFDVAFDALSPALRDADLGFANLEMPVGEPALIAEGKTREFWHDPEVIPALAEAGVQLVSIANDHIMACGPTGLRRTIRACTEAGIQTIGAGENLEAARRPARFLCRTRRVVALGYAAATDEAAGEHSPGVAPLDWAVIEEDLERWRPEADVLIVSVHWGSMYVDYPPPRVLELAEQLFGRADLVLGHHPHVMQGVQHRDGTVMLLSLGDAVFDARAGEISATVASDLRPQAGVFTVDWADQPGLDYLPITIDEDGIPGWPVAEQGAAQAMRLRRLSAGLSQGRERFAAESAPRLLDYELQSLQTYVRQGRIDRVVRLIGGVRLRHLPVLWQAIKRGRKAA